MTNIQRVGQRYHPGDRVKKRTATGNKPPRYGTILNPIEDKDRRGSIMWYYSVQWDDLKSPATHAQQSLIPLND
tara:strand:+ start:385 stop:606 length:222 start_codon:yes stop_codon:yes gene_type:complete